MSSAVWQLSQRLVEGPYCLIEVPERMNQQLRGVEHGLQIVLVELDRLPVVLESQVEIAVCSVDVTDQVVCVGRVPVELQRLLGRSHRAVQIALADELPAPIEVGAEAVHEAFVLLRHGQSADCTWGL